MKKLITLLAILSISLPVYAFDLALPVQSESQAYKLYSRQPKSELSKLLYLMNRFKEGDGVEVIYNGQHYKAEEAFRIGRDFLRKNYKKETADYWIKKYCTRTEKGSLILLKDAKNETRPAGEVAMEELKNLPATA